MEFLTRAMTLAFAGFMLFEKYLDWRDERSDKEELREALQEERAHTKELEASKRDIFEAYTDAVEQYMAIAATTKSLDNAAKVQYLENELAKTEAQRDAARLAAAETLEQNLGFHKYIRELAGPNETQEETEEVLPSVVQNTDGTLTIVYPAGWQGPTGEDFYEHFEANEFLEEDNQVE